MMQTYAFLWIVPLRLEILPSPANLTCIIQQFSPVYLLISKRKRSARAIRSSSCLCSSNRSMSLFSGTNFSSCKGASTMLIEKLKDRFTFLQVCLRTTAIYTNYINSEIRCAYCDTISRLGWVQTGIHRPIHTLVTNIFNKIWYFFMLFVPFNCNI